MSRVQVSVGIIILILELFLLINADALFPEFGTKVRDVMIVYILLQTAILAAFATKLPALSFRPDTLLLMVIGLVGTLFVVSILPTIIFSAFEPIPFQEVITVATLGFLFLYAAIKAFVEEAVFRGVLMPRIGLVPQAIIFGVFHFAVLAALGASFIAVLFSAIVLAGLGYVWGLMSQRGTIMLSWGSHIAWNLAAVGVAGMLLFGGA